MDLFKDVRDIEKREQLDYEQETLVHSLMMDNPGIGKVVAKIKAMSLILKQEREQTFCDFM